MTREIKFRVWDGNLDEYFSWEDSVKFNNYHNLMEKGYGNVFIEQYTGLKDKNGVEIYEGDIVKWGEKGLENPIRIARVLFNPDIQFSSNVGIFNFGDFAYKDTEKYLEVIGNIHENADLLEK